MTGRPQLVLVVTAPEDVARAEEEAAARARHPAGKARPRPPLRPV